MKIDVRINSLTPGEGNVKAIASANLDDCFAVKNIRVIEGKNGLFLSMPADKWKDTSTGETKHIDIVHPTNADTRAELFKAVKDAYEKSQTQSSAAPTDDAQPFDIG